MDIKCKIGGLSMFNENELTFTQVKMLDEEGNIIGNPTITTSDEQLWDMYEWMKKARILDQKLLRLQRQGRLGTYAPLSGQEAAQVGSAYALTKEDWVAPSYRDHAVSMVHGLPLEQIISYSKGHLYGGKIPEGLRILPVQIIIAAQTLHATGIAYSSKYKGENSVAITYFGDGATSQGDFHEALNFASVFKLPVIFFCQNNQYAISVPLERQMASKTIAQKAVAYGMTGVQVDGNDILAVHEVTKEAIERARNGEGPTLIEAVTYRFGPHTTSDDPTRYRSEEEVKQWSQQKDPLIRLRKYLENKGLWDETKDNQLEESFNDELNELIDVIESKPIPTVDEAFDYVYENKHDLLVEQQEEAKRFLANGGGE